VWNIRGKNVTFKKIPVLLWDEIVFLEGMRISTHNLLRMFGAVECIRLEESFAKENDPKLLERAREVLDDDISDTLDGLNEMDCAD